MARCIAEADFLLPLHSHFGTSEAFESGDVVIETASRSKDVIDAKTINHIEAMYLDKAKKEEIFGQYGKTATDTGSAESQIALFTYRIAHLTEHVKKNHKDFATTRSLTRLVGKRRRLLDYLYDRDVERYRAIIKALGLRR